MISIDELNAIKGRMVLAGDAARRIIESPAVVYYEPDAYWPVRTALLELSSDVRQVLAELDLLRVMFHERISGFLGEQSHEGRDDQFDAGSVSQGGTGSAEEPVPPASEGRVDDAVSPGDRQVEGGAAVGLPSVGADGGQGGAKPRGNRGRRKKSKGVVEPGGEGEPVGGE